MTKKRRASLRKNYKTLCPLFRRRLALLLHNRNSVPSIQSFSYVTGIHPNTLYQYMRGVREPSLYNLLKLRIGFSHFGIERISVDWMLGLSPKMFLETPHE